MSKNVIPVVPVHKRECGECTACCEGWLHGEAHGHTFYSGKPCFFLCKGCAIYDQRPEHPCKSYKCTWLEDDILPMWMRPDLGGVIVTKRHVKDMTFYSVTETGKPIEAKVLNYLIQLALNKQLNIEYFIEGGQNRIGSTEFIELRNKQMRGEEIT